MWYGNGTRVSRLITIVCRFVVIFVDGGKDVSLIAQELHCLPVEDSEKVKNCVSMVCNKEALSRKTKQTTKEVLLALLRCIQ